MGGGLRSAGHRRPRGSARRTVLLLLTLALLGTAATAWSVARRLDGGRWVAGLLSRALGADVRVASLGWRYPDTLTLDGLEIRGGALERPVLIPRALLRFSAAAAATGSPVLDELAAEGVSLPLATRLDGSLANEARDAMGSLALVLTALAPRRVVARDLEVCLTSPLLTEGARLRGTLDLLRRGSGYRLGGRLTGDGLTLDAGGDLDVRTPSGRLTVGLRTTDGPVALVGPEGAELRSRFGYRAVFELASRGSGRLDLRLASGRAEARDGQLHLPWLAVPLHIESARIRQGGALVVESADLTLAGHPLTYEGPLAPSPTDRGSLRVRSASLATLLAGLGGPTATGLPRMVAEAHIEADLSVAGLTPGGCTGRVAAVLPPGALAGVAGEVRMVADVAAPRSTLELRRGAITGAVVADGWQADVDPVAGELTLAIYGLHAPLGALVAAAGERLGALAPAARRAAAAEALVSLRLSVPLRAPESATGTAEVAVLEPAAGRGALPFGLTAAQASLALQPRAVTFRRLRLAAHGLREFEAQGELRDDGALSLAFVARGCAGAPGEELNSVTGRLELGASAALDAALREPGGTEVRCAPVAGRPGQHVLTWRRDGVDATLQLASPTRAAVAKALAQGSLAPLMPKVCELALAKGPWRLTARIDAARPEGCGFVGRVAAGTVEGPCGRLEVEGGAKIGVAGTGVTVEGARLQGRDGGGILLSGTATLGGTIEALEARASGLRIDVPGLPTCTLSGTVDLAGKGPSTQGRVALTAARTKPSGAGFRTASLLLDYRDGLLALRRARVRTAAGELALEGSLPARWSPERPGSVDLLDGPMDLSLRATTFALAALHEVVPGLAGLAGQLTGEAHVGGTTSRPALSGAVELAGASLTPPLAPAGVTGLSLRAELSGDALDVSALQATWDGLVTVRADALRATDVRLHPALSAAVELRGGYVRGGPFEAGGLGLRGTLAQGPRLKGTLTVERVRCQSESSRLASEASLRRAFATLEPLVNSPVLVDLAIEARRNVWTRAPSIAAEFGGALHARFGAGQGEVTGDLQVLRGDLYLQGRRFKLQRGTLGFSRAGAAIPLPRMDLLGQTNVGGMTVDVRLVGNPLVEGGMMASLASDDTDWSQDRLLGLMTPGQNGAEALTAPLLNELGYQLLSAGLERSLRRVLPFDEVGIGGDLSLGSNSSPTITMGKYLTPDLYLNLEGGFAHEQGSFLQELKLDIAPPDSNLKLSIARGFAGAEDGDTRAAVEYSVRF